MSAYSALMEQQREQSERNELQGAQICNLLYETNRDSKKSSAKTTADWQFFGKKRTLDEDQLPAEVAQICLALRHEERLPPLLIGIWGDVVERGAIACHVPEIRCLASKDRSVAVIAPTWESSNLRAFLAVKGHPPGEVVEVFDVDRPLMDFRVQLPSNIQPVHFESGVLLLNADQSVPKATLM